MCIKKSDAPLLVIGLLDDDAKIAGGWDPLEMKRGDIIFFNYFFNYFIIIFTKIPK